MSSSGRIDNKKKCIFIFSEGPTQGLDETALTAEANYSKLFLFIFAQSNKLCLSFHYNGSNSSFIC